MTRKLTGNKVLKAQLDAIRAHGYSVAGFVRMAIEKALGADIDRGVTSCPLSSSGQWPIT